MLKSLFVHKLKDALQSSENKYHMLKGEIISIVKETGFSGENIEEIVDTCWNDIMPGEKYEKFEGILFYEFLQVLMWLSIVFIQKNDDTDPQDNKDEMEISEDLLLDKFGYFLEMLESIVKKVEEENS